MNVFRQSMKQKYKKSSGKEFARVLDSYIEKDNTGKRNQSKLLERLELEVEEKVNLEEEEARFLYEGVRIREDAEGRGVLEYSPDLYEGREDVLNEKVILLILEYIRSRVGEKIIEIQKKPSVKSKEMEIVYELYMEEGELRRLERLYPVRLLGYSVSLRVISEIINLPKTTVAVKYNEILKK